MSSPQETNREARWLRNAFMVAGIGVGVLHLVRHEPVLISDAWDMYTLGSFVACAYLSELSIVEIDVDDESTEV